jgi:hypothetical protein
MEAVDFHGSAMLTRDEIDQLVAGFPIRAAPAA